MNSYARNEREAPMSGWSGLPDFHLFLVVAVLICVGIIMVFSSSGFLSNFKWSDGAHFLKKEIFFVALAVAVMIVSALFDYRYLRSKNVLNLIWIASIATLLAVLVPGIGVVRNGAMRWIAIGPFQFQPSEPAKIALIILLANYLTGVKAGVKSLEGFGKGLLIAFVFCLLILFERDFGLCMVNFFICLMMLFVAGARLGHIAPVVVGVGTVAWKLVLLDEVRSRRIFAFLDPWADPQGSGFHIIQSLIAVASGGWLGRGLGMGQQKRFYLPEQHTDFIFSVIIEELGFLGLALILCAFVYLAYRGTMIALNCPDRFGMLLAFGITFSISIQAFINMGVAIGILPVTGLTLPFISYGGTSLISTLAMVGILMNISTNVGPGRRAAYDGR